MNIGGVHVGLVECNGKPLKFTQSQSNVSIGRKSRKTGFWQFDSFCHMWQWRVNSIERKNSLSKRTPQTLLKSLSLKITYACPQSRSVNHSKNMMLLRKISQSGIEIGKQKLPSATLPALGFPLCCRSWLEKQHLLYYRLIEPPILKLLWSRFCFFFLAGLYVDSTREMPVDFQW